MFAAVNRRIFGALFAAVSGIGASVAIAACGDEAHLKAGRTLNISEMEYRLRPNHVVAASGSALKIAIHNDGHLTHNFIIARATPTTTVLTTATGTATETTTVAGRSPDLAPGQSTTITVNLAPGRYGIASTIDTDQTLGEQGSLTVTSK